MQSDVYKIGAEGQTEGVPHPQKKGGVYITQVDIMEITLLNINKPKEKKKRDLFKIKWIKLKLYWRQLRCL